MDFDEVDILSLALDIVENDTNTTSDIKSVVKINNGKSLCVSETKNSFEDKDNLFLEDQDDILALAIEDIEKQASSTPIQKKNKSLVGVDLCFDTNDDVPSTKLPSKGNAERKNKSEIHTGDTDSSDDEDNKYSYESQYDSYGKSLKKALQDNVKRKQLGAIGRESFKGKPVNSCSPVSIPKQISQATVKVDVTADPIFGIRIINPLISSQAMREAMVGRNPIGCIRIKSHVMHGDLKADWVFAAVVVRKFPPKVSQNGNTYSMWILSDLKNDLKTVCLFLFGKAHEELWKTPSGIVLAILNPAVLGDDKKSEYEAKLSIKSADQVMIWGKSKDFGQCKSRKKNGDVCGAFVNTSQCEFCVYHVKQEYNKYNARADFGNNGRVKLKNKVLGKNEVFYGGKSFMASPIVGKKVVNPKDGDRLKGLGTNSVPTKSSNENVQIPNLPRSNNILNLLPKGTMNKLTDEKRLTNLFSSFGNKSLHSNPKLSKPAPPPTSSKQAVLEIKKPALSDPGSGITLDMDQDFKSKIPNTGKSDKKYLLNSNKNKLQKRFHGLMAISSEISGSNKKSVFSGSSKNPENVESPPVDILPVVASTPRNVNSIEKQTTKEKAFTNIKPLLKEESNPSIESKSSLKLPESAEHDKPLDSGSPRLSGALPLQHRKNLSSFTPPNSGMSRAKLKALAFIKNKGPINKDNPSGTDLEKKRVKRPLSPSNDENSENNLPVLSERFIQLMNQKSIHEDLVELRENEQEEEYFERLEKKDRLEEKMLNTFKVDCKAVKCLKCNYTWFSAAEACKAEGHPTKVIDAFKRFFKCGNCSNRTVCLTFIPLIPCKKCSSSYWIRAPMIPERLAKNDSLSIRGGEQKFFNSGVTNGSLNLLVPD